MDVYNENLSSQHLLSNRLWKPDGNNFTNQKLNNKKSSVENIMNNSWFSCTKQSKFKKYKDWTYNPKTNITSPGIKIKEGQLRIRTIRIRPSKIQEEKIKEAINLSRALYNKCVAISQRTVNPVNINSKTLRKLLACGKKSDESELTEKQKEAFYNIPSVIRDGAIQDFIKAYEIQKKLKKEGKIKHFKMDFRRKKDKIQESIVIAHERLLEKGGIKGDYLVNPKKKGTYRLYPDKWSDEILKTYKEHLPSGINHDCRLIMKTTGSNEKFYLAVPMTIDIKPKEKMCSAVALDPGVKIFQTTYDTEGHSYKIGENDVDKLDQMSRIACRMREGKKRIWIDGKRIFVDAIDNNEKKGLMKAARNIEQKIKNKISDLHRKTVKFLCTKYDTVIIPNFQSKQMAEKKDGIGNWKRGMSKETTRRMIRWGHYQFRELLKAKGTITGTNIYVGTEEYTSKTCGNCFYINCKLELTDREFKCPRCDHTYHRDLNAARNIMLLNFEKSGLKLAPLIKLVKT